MATGETGFQALDHFPGPRALNVNWVVILTGVALAVLLKGSYQRRFVVALRVIPCLVYFATGEPVQMIKVACLMLVTMSAFVLMPLGVPKA
jgi:hypothetical protein